MSSRPPRQSVETASTINDLADRLRQLRQRAGLTGTRLAELSGMSQSKVSKIENGRQLPTAADIEAIAQALGLKDEVVEELASGAERLRVELAIWRVEQPG